MQISVRLKASTGWVTENRWLTIANPKSTSTGTFEDESRMLAGSVCKDIGSDVRRMSQSFIGRLHVRILTDVVM